MKDQKRKTWIAGALLALAASLCCLTPVLALLSGVSGIAATFSFLEPLRPYLISLTVLVLGFAWYQKLKRRKEQEIDCECEERPSFWQSKTFLGVVTVFTIALLAFPSYSHIFYSGKESAVPVAEASSTRVIDFSISGMTCAGCEEHVKHAVNKVDGVLESNANHQAGTAMIKFDSSKVTVDKLVDAINETGYKVENYRVQNQATSIKFESLNRIELKVSGMTCSGCEKHVEHALKGLDGIVEVSTTYKEGIATVRYDVSKVTSKEIREVINRTGYKVIEDK